MSGLFDLLLIFIFFVLPVISNIIRANQKRSKARAQKKQGGQSTSAVPQTPTQAQTAQPRSAQPVVQPVSRPPAQAGGAESSKADFERRLAEARARVQQSMEGNQPAQGSQSLPHEARAQAPQQQPTPRQQPARPQVRPQARPQQRSLEVLSPLGGKTAKAKSIESGSLEGQSLERPALERPVRTQRPRTLLTEQRDNRKATSLLLGGRPKKSVSHRKANNPDELLSMDDKSIMRGLIWKQILDTPKSKKRLSNYK